MKLILVAAACILAAVIFETHATGEGYPICYRNSEFISNNDRPPVDEHQKFLRRFVLSPFGMQFTPMQHYFSYLEACIYYKGDTNALETYMRSLLKEIQT